MASSQLRIIGGQWRSRKIEFPDLPDLRPTPARVRETLFNWLQYDLAGSNCLDLFAGSGALGFEAASRGARQVMQVENNALACRQLSATATKLQAQQIKLYRQDVFAFLAGDAQPCDLVFMDPPFKNDIAAQVCHWLEDKNWLTAQAKIYVEIKRQAAFSEYPEHWQCLRNKSTGDVSYYLLSRS